MSTETIYQSLYVSSRGALRRELTACLRTGRKLQRRNRIPDMINIAERPQEADDRAVPGHPALEDKLLQRAVVEVLKAMYE